MDVTCVCLSFPSRNWVTGFGKRKQQRREYGAIQLAKKQRIARNEARKLVSRCTRTARRDNTRSPQQDAKFNLLLFLAFSSDVMR